jgi:hypothetical protein
VRLGSRPDLEALLGTVRTTRDGAAWLVLGAEARYHSENSDDDGNQRSGWYLTLHVREATSEEAAPALAERAARLAEVERRTDAVLALDR